MSKFSGSGCRIRGVWSLFYAASTARLTCRACPPFTCSRLAYVASQELTPLETAAFHPESSCWPTRSSQIHRSWQTLPSCALTAVCDVQALAVSSHPLPLSNLFLNALLHRRIPLSLSYLCLLLSSSYSHRYTHTHIHTHTYARKHTQAKVLHVDCLLVTLNIPLDFNPLRDSQPSPSPSLQTSIATMAPMIQPPLQDTINAF